MYAYFVLYLYVVYNELYFCVRRRRHIEKGLGRVYLNVLNRKIDCLTYDLVSGYYSCVPVIYVIHHICMHTNTLLI